MDESPIPPRTPRRSRYSLYQSDYETAAEDSDGSLYYSLRDDDEKENDLERKENHPMSPRNNVSSERSLLEKRLQKSLNLTPRNEFNKRVSFDVNPLIASSSIRSPSIALHGRIGLRETCVFKTGNEVTKRSKNDESSNLPDSSSATENITEMFASLNASTANDTHDSDIVEVNEEDKSVNSTIIARATNAIETITEVSEETTIEASEEEVGAFAVTSSSPVNINVKTIDVPRGPTRIGQASSNQRISTTFGLSNLPLPKKVSIGDPLPTTSNSHVPSSKRLSLFRGQSTHNYGFSRPNGKSGIPIVSLMLARNNSVIHTSALSSSSQYKCQYCDKTFAKQSILNVHLLEKCDKIPPARYRQLQRQQTYPN